jgi:hypothetical protein
MPYMPNKNKCTFLGPGSICGAIGELEKGEQPNLCGSQIQ